MWISVATVFRMCAVPVSGGEHLWCEPFPVAELDCVATALYTSFAHGRSVTCRGHN